jgi:hypothetical protein
MQGSICIPVIVSSHLSIEVFNVNSLDFNFIIRFWKSMSDDAEIGSIPITEQTNLSKDKVVNYREVEEFLEENRKLQAQ